LVTSKSKIISIQIHSHSWPERRGSE
jgi:hypothetical protein